MEQTFGLARPCEESAIGHALSFKISIFLAQNREGVGGAAGGARRPFFSTLPGSKELVASLVGGHVRNEVLRSTRRVPGVKGGRGRRAYVRMQSGTIKNEGGEG